MWVHLSDCEICLGLLTNGGAGNVSVSDYNGSAHTDQDRPGLLNYAFYYRTGCVTRATKYVSWMRWVMCGESGIFDFYRHQLEPGFHTQARLFTMPIFAERSRKWVFEIYSSAPSQAWPKRSSNRSDCVQSMCSSLDHLMPQYPPEAGRSCALICVWKRLWDVAFMPETWEYAEMPWTCGHRLPGFCCFYFKNLQLWIGSWGFCADALPFNYGAQMWNK